MKRALVVALVLALIVGLLAAPVEAKTKRRRPAASREGAGPGRVTCPSGVRRVKVGDNLQAKINSAGRGASLCFTPGTYRLRGALRPLARQVLTFERGAVLNGSKLVTNWTKDGRYWVAGGQKQSFSTPSWMQEKMCDNNPGACIHEDVYRDDKPLKHVTSINKLRPGRVYFDKGADKIYISDDPQGHTMEATVAWMAIDSEGDGVTIRGATIEKFAHTGIWTKASRWTIAKSDIRQNHFQAIGIYGGTGHVIQGTRVRRNGVIGMTAVKVADFTVRRNEFGHNNYLHAGPVAGGHHEGSVKILRSHDVLIRDNWSHHNYGDGLWFDSNNHDILIENNLLERNTRNGIRYEVSFDATVRYNTIRNNGTVWAAQGAGISNSTSKNVKYYGNRIANNVIRSVVIQWRPRGGSEKYGEAQSANLLFRDNDIVFHNNFESWVGAYANSDPRVFSSNNRFKGNTYIAPKDGERAGERWWRWGGDSLTWAEWRAHGLDKKGSFHRSEPGQKKDERRDDKKRDDKKRDDKKREKKDKDKKKKKPPTEQVTSKQQLFLRDADGCDSNKNSLSVKNGPDKGCRNINQNPTQVWSAIGRTRFKLDASRPITGEVTTAGGECVSDAGCLLEGLWVGEAQVDIIVLGTIGGKERRLGAHTETFFVAPGDTHTSQVKIKLDPAPAKARVASLKILTRLHGAAIGHDVVVLEHPASFIKVPTLVAR